MSITSLDSILNKAKQDNTRQSVAIVAAEDIAVIKAALQAKELGLIAPIFIGNSKTIQNLIRAEAGKLETQIVPAANSEEAAKTAVSGVLSGRFDFLMKGNIPTKVLLREVVNRKRGIAGEGLLSHFSLFEIPGFPRLISLTDAAMNIAPDAEEKVKIVQNSVKALNKLGYSRPKVALLAAIEKVNPKMIATTDAQTIVEQHARHSLGECDISGPLALDGAISEVAASHKGIRNNVAGQADLLVVPDINSGNILYKSLIYLAKAETAGVILGAKSPIILTSRADSEKSKLYSIALAKCLC